ncbi:hypothetical protein QR680_017437 [Steinernema hermaphroditum]|uniref:Uncharacterized protein n=1 Tax=Steinernema hermaphroditum TaxID=289476 RepID=A0AA39HEJ0_9BILA|nr:hypothetical protein QR680_017437 [Steinernema hermaphroditum]
MLCALLLLVVCVLGLLPSDAAKCSANEICSTSHAHVCLNGTCVSACFIGGMRECQCDLEEDNYCYLCCGNERNACRPAHQHNILRTNGERWERETCARCRMNSMELEGLPCDDRDPQRLCLQGKCSNSVCSTKRQGEFCDRKMEKVCVEDVCENPCARFSPHLLPCECSEIDPNTGFASDDRCQLCCYDFSVKPASQRCQNAFRKYQIATSKNRPIWREGLDCVGGKKCNRYGICAAPGLLPSSLALGAPLLVTLLGL